MAAQTRVTCGVESLDPRARRPFQNPAVFAHRQPPEPARPQVPGDQVPAQRRQCVYSELPGAQPADAVCVHGGRDEEADDWSARVRRHAAHVRRCVTANDPPRTLTIYQSESQSGFNGFFSSSVVFWIFSGYMLEYPAEMVMYK